jgi:integrase
MTFLTTARGKPFSSDVFGNWFECTAAGLVGRSAHGLRKATAVRLAEAGATTKQIQAVTGHASLREVERYSKGAEQERLARAAVSRLVRREGGGSED